MSKLKKHNYYQTVMCGEHWAKLSIEWSDTGCTTSRNEKASEIAEDAFVAGANKVRDIIRALMGKWKEN
jgi:hypothetical protein